MFPTKPVRYGQDKGMIRCMENGLENWTQRVVIRDTKSSQWKSSGISTDDLY